VPEKPLDRSLIFACMTLNAALLLLIRCFSIAMLLIVSSTTYWTMAAIETGAFVIYKIARRDVRAP
jgi:hypothetical protein